MLDAFICDAVRTPIGRFGGSLAVTESDSLQAGRQDCPGPFEQWAEGTVGDATRLETCMLETR